MTARPHLTSDAIVEGLKTHHVDLHRLQRSVNGYLLDHVGDLLVAGEAVPATDGEWSFPILLSTNRRGILGEVGRLKVSRQGLIEPLTDTEIEEVERRAREVATGSAF